ncbi:MAG: hypothetical protein WAO78_08015, partial [Roseovarius sp.]
SQRFLRKSQYFQLLVSEKWRRDSQQCLVEKQYLKVPQIKLPYQNTYRGSARFAILTGKDGGADLATPAPRRSTCHEDPLRRPAPSECSAGQFAGVADLFSTRASIGSGFSVVR